MQQPRYILIIIKTYLHSYYFFKQNKKNKNKILLKKKLKIKQMENLNILTKTERQILK